MLHKCFTTELQDPHLVLLYLTFACYLTDISTFQIHISYVLYWRLILAVWSTVTFKKNSAEIIVINITLIIMYNTTNKKNIVGLWDYPKIKDTVTKLNDMSFFFTICVVEWKKWILKVDIWPLLVAWNTHVCIHTY